MLDLRIILDGDGAFEDLSSKRAEGKVRYSNRITVAYLSGGMASGKPSVFIRIDLEDGTVVLGETSFALFQGAAAAGRGRFGDDGTGEQIAKA